MLRISRLTIHISRWCPATPTSTTNPFRGGNGGRFSLFICNSNFLNFQLPVQWCGSRNSQFLIAAGLRGRGAERNGVAPRPDNAVGGAAPGQGRAGQATLCARSQLGMLRSALSVRAPCSCYFILIENENVISLPTKMLAAAASATASASNEKRARNVAKFV